MSHHQTTGTGGTAFAKLQHSATPIQALIKGQSGSEKPHRLGVVQYKVYFYESGHLIYGISFRLFRSPDILCIEGKVMA